MFLEFQTLKDFLEAVKEDGAIVIRANKSIHHSQDRFYAVGALTYTCLNPKLTSLGYRFIDTVTNEEALTNKELEQAFEEKVIARKAELDKQFKDAGHEIKDGLYTTQ